MDIYIWSHQSIVERSINMPLKGIPCTIMRGGTSKGVFFRREVLPEDPAERERVILRIFGSGDPMQIDGLGGSHTHTSKVMIVWRSERDDVDVEYLFGQVGIDREFIDWTGNCGNLTSAVGPFAIDEGLVEAREPVTVVRALNVNTGKRIDIAVPVENGSVKYEGDYMIDGVPRPGARIDTIWRDPGGAVLGRGLLPTGRARDYIEADGRVFEVSIVDSANLAVFVRARDVGLSGAELPGEVPREILDLLEEIRSRAAELLGMADDWRRATIETPHQPFIVVVGERQDYTTSLGRRVSRDSYSVLARLFSMQKMHHAMAVTGAICIGSAARYPGTVVNELAEVNDRRVVIAHPKGLIEVYVDLESEGGKPHISSVTVSRTARRLMKGVAYYIE